MKGLTAKGKVSMPGPTGRAGDPALPVRRCPHQRLLFRRRHGDCGFVRVRIASPPDSACPRSGSAFHRAEARLLPQSSAERPRAGHTGLQSTRPGLRCGLLGRLVRPAEYRSSAGSPPSRRGPRNPAQKKLVRDWGAGDQRACRRHPGLRPPPTDEPRRLIATFLPKRAGRIDRILQSPPPLAGGNVILPPFGRHWELVTPFTSMFTSCICWLYDAK
jgi:hypothetical protein